MDTKVLIKSDSAKASLLALTGFFFMAVFGILTKIALQDTSTIWVSFIAYLTGTFALLPYIFKKGFSYLKSDHYKLLFGRALIGTLASFLYSLSIHYIPIVNGTLLFNTAPIFIPILALLFLKVKVSNNVWLAVALGFLGITIIIKPTEAIFTESGNLIALLSGFCLAIAYLLMKLLTNTDPGVRIIFYYLGLGTLAQIPFLFFSPSWPSMDGILFALASGFSLCLAQISLVAAYKYANASEVGVYQYSTVAFVGVFDWLIWNVVPGWWDLIGILLVVMAGMIIIRSHNHNDKVKVN